MITVAALFVDERGVYADIPGVDVWGAVRDARLYPGPHPVICHPPCSRWCRLAGLVEARWGYRKGDDGGCFASALASVRKWGGVLEHPAYSDAWATFGLPRPPGSGGWVRGLCGGWSCHVEQWHYGHAAKKTTWLYAFGCELPSLRWGSTPDTATTAYVGHDTPGSVRAIGRRAKLPAPVSWCDNHVANGEVRPRLGKRAASATPPAFRDMLLAMAEGVNNRRVSRAMVAR